MIATLTITPTDPQHRIRTVEFQTQVDDEAASAWFEPTDEITASGVIVTVEGKAVTIGQDSPYSTSVDFADTATICRRVTYIGTTGMVTGKKCYDFPTQYDPVTAAGVPVTASGVLVTTRRR
jgi:hypothetical protein